jgi:hypothetical protein
MTAPPASRQTITARVVLDRVPVGKTARAALDLPC